MSGSSWTMKNFMSPREFSRSPGKKGSETPYHSGMPTLAADKKAFGRNWARSAQALARLPGKPERSASQQARAEEILADSRASRATFMRRHARAVYDAL